MTFCIFFSASACAKSDESLKSAMQASNDGGYATVYKIIYPMAARGDPDSQFSLALILANDVSIGTEMSQGERERQAVIWLKKSAYSGHVNSAKILSDIFKNGFYKQPVNLEAADCWERVAEKKNSPTLCIALQKEWAGSDPAN